MTRPTPMAQSYDVAMLDLDGVVYSGEEAIPHAADALAAAVALGMRLAFVTNNASRTPQTVRDHLRAVGVPAETDQIITSAQVAGRALAQRLAAGSRVLVVGDVGLRQEVLAAGMTVVDDAAADPDAVVQGHSARTGWAQLVEAVVAVRRGALWVAANLDSTLPSPRGPLPGNGSMVAVVAAALGRRPDVVTGKPDPTMHAETVGRTGARAPLVVGDRLDTDIEGATAVGVDSLLVLTGLAGPVDLLNAPPPHRPTYVAADLRALLDPPRVPVVDGAGWSLGRWRAQAVGGCTEVMARTRRDGDDAAGSGRAGRGSATSTADERLDVLRVVSAAVWAGGPVALRTSDQDAHAAASELGLPIA